MKNHLKRHFAPKTWKIKRKGITFITRPNSGPHKLEMSLPLNVVLRDMLQIAATKREVRIILANKSVSVDGMIRGDYRFPVGLFDVLSLKETDENFRVILDSLGKINLIKIPKTESKVKPCRIIGKVSLKGRTQLNFNDGKNILVEKGDYRVGDVVLLNLGKKTQIKDTIKLEKDILIFLTGGKHMGHVGKVEDIKGNRVIYKTQDLTVETLKKYVFPIGKEKPAITLNPKETK